jgi:competence protein ComEA
MESKLDHFKKWFGYNRRERRATSILLLIAAIVFISRYLVPGKPVEIRNLSSEIITYMPDLIIPDSIQSDSVRLFRFDPNIVTQEELIKLGLSEKQAGTIQNYRKAGGKFYIPSDFSKIYGIDQKKIAELLPYVYIGDTNNLSRPVFQQKQTELMDLNTSDSIMLDILPGIGPILSARIVKYRNLLGGYSNKNQLNEVYGLSPETFVLISEKVYADSIVVKRIKINQASYTELIRHPYFEAIEVTSMIKYRELKGRISNINELIENKIITPEQGKKISPYLLFE